MFQHHQQRTVMIHFQRRESVLLFPRLLRSWANTRCTCLTPLITDVRSCFACGSSSPSNISWDLCVHFKINVVFSVQCLNWARIKSSFFEERERGGGFLIGLGVRKIRSHFLSKCLSFSQAFGHSYLLISH